MYHVELDRSPSKKDLALWRQGIMLDGKRTLPAKIKLIQGNKLGKTIEIILTEGRNRQIRRVAEKLGYQVQKLHRTAIGSITIDTIDRDRLTKGNYRHLQPAEIGFLKNSYYNQPNKVVAQPGGALDD